MVGGLVVGGGPLVVGGGALEVAGGFVRGVVGAAVDGGWVTAVVTAVLGTDDVGELPPPPPLVNARATNTMSATRPTTRINEESNQFSRSPRSKKSCNGR